MPGDPMGPWAGAAPAARLGPEPLGAARLFGPLEGGGQLAFGPREPHMPATSCPRIAPERNSALCTFT